MENSSPDPSFSICDIRIQKQMSRSFGKSSSYRSCTPFGWSTISKGLAKVSHTFSPKKIALPKLRPHCSATCLNTWKAEPRKKNTLSFFKRNFTPAKSEMLGVFFLSGLPRLCEAVAERFIHHSDFARNTFELCPEHTANKKYPSKDRYFLFKERSKPLVWLT